MRVIDLSLTNDPRDAIRQAVNELVAGHIVALPDECGWSVVGLSTVPAAVERLGRLRASLPATVSPIALWHPDLVRDYIDEPSVLMTKFAHRCWPGPVVLREHGAQPQGLAVEWPASAQTWGVNSQGRAFYVPGDNVAGEILQHLQAPACALLPVYQLTSLPESDEISLKIIGAKPRYDQPVTVVRIERDQFEIESPGVVSQRMLQRLSGHVVLFVCTGNTCRSPMAEFMFRKMLAKRLKCSDDELIDRGYVVMSAGLSAYPGSPANREAVNLLKLDAIDLTSHESQLVTVELLLRSDSIITMTNSHAEAILHSLPELSHCVRTLSPNGKDISDPIGGGPDEYARCKDEIVLYLETLLNSMPA